MTGLYLFCAAVGIPLLLWFSFAGDADGFGEAEADGPLAFLSLSTMSFVLGFFGLTGLLLEIVGTAGLITLLVAIITAVAAGACNSAAFRWLRKNSNSSEVMDHELEGMIANVALPISGEHRGKIILTKAGAREQMTATPVDGSTIDPGERVVIVRVEGGVALVAPLGPDLELG
jgi:membrane protein implicated in regulation of membrane protease activity